MSFDIYAHIDTGAGNLITTFDRNLTYNVSKMLFDAFGEKGIRVLNKTSAKEALPILKDVIVKFQENIELYKSWNPPNGWGNYDITLSLIQDLYEHCKFHPNVEISVT